MIMLYSRSEREHMAQRTRAFGLALLEAISHAHNVVEARGKDRDVGLPIHYKRTAFGDADLAKSKALRVESLLAQIDPENPDLDLVKKVLEEASDGANYFLFLVARMMLILQDEEESDGTG
ncbi:MAG: hypothetical protein GF414_04570 [Candidatus Altiarchaeales archaeon]|nr:hypothetical protein [Candidatus Altiarchaeales archaeon]